MTLPQILEWFLSVPLYESVDLEGGAAISQIENFSGPLDAYCVGCQQDSVFVETPPTHIKFPRTPSSSSSNVRSPRLHRVFWVELECSRNQSHLMHFYFRVTDTTLTKIGQYPSRADLESPHLKKYSKILGREKFQELRRAVGLNAHGIGIGAYVYLRRILEDEVEQAHQEASKDTGWDEDVYARSRMDENIPLLKDFLPPFLVENRGMYSIMSKGIHELSEQECLQHFHAVQMGIEMILDQKIAAKEQFEKEEAAKKALEHIVSKL